TTHRPLGPGVTSNRCAAASPTGWYWPTTSAGGANCSAPSPPLPPPAAPAPPPRTWRDIEPLCGRFANWLVLAHHVRRRGELLRAVDALAHVERHLLWMARLVEDNTEHWLTPPGQAEAELSPPTIQTLVRSTAVAEDAAIRAAILDAWSCGR